MDNILIALEKLPQDIRDFSHHDVFGTVAPADIPLIDFSVGLLPPIIEDQKNLDFCTGFAGSELNTVAQLTDGSIFDYLQQIMKPNSVHDRASLAVQYGLVPTIQNYLDLALKGQNAAINLQLFSYLMRDNGDYFDPLYQFAKTKQVRGEFASYGANIRDVAQSLVKYGSIKKNQSPFTYMEGKPSDKTRDFIANWNNWSTAFDAEAAKNKLGSFFMVDGPYDAFDNIRSTLWKNKQAKIPIGILFGLNWRPEWTNAPHGIINETYPSSQGDPHCLDLIGEKVIDNVPYITAQNSWNASHGDNGLFYFPRNVINTEFEAGFGAVTFKKLSKALAQHYVDNEIMAGDNWLYQIGKPLYNTLINIWKHVA